MADELSPKAIEALGELNRRSPGERPLMLEWDIESELRKRDFIEEVPNGGWQISERGRAYVRSLSA
ncbi:hypothetical protein LJR230_004620 [Trinickia sp. LjRoot230]|uniref:hypothetical protein n=1 Tax=Trinickia sp. LjRoot230 TaxID=3342288 RepID=UPI003ECF6215